MIAYFKDSSFALLSLESEDQIDQFLNRGEENRTPYLRFIRPLHQTIMLLPINFLIIFLNLRSENRTHNEEFLAGLKVLYHTIR